MKTKTILILFLGLLLIFSACSVDVKSDFEKQVESDNAKIEKYLSDNGIVAEESSAGYYYQILVENLGGFSISQGDVVEMYYSVSLLDGTVLDNYMDESQPPAVFKQGVEGGLIPVALDWCIGMMHVGETFRIFIPSYNAYYDYAYEDQFPAYSNFIIDVKVVGIKTEGVVNEAELDSIQSYITQNNIENAVDYPSGLYYIEDVEGTGSLPSSTSLVNIFYTIKLLDGTVIGTRESETEPLSIYLSDETIIAGLREGIALMKEGGEATFIMPSKLAYKESRLVLPSGLMDAFVEDGRLNLNIEPYTPVIYEVKLDKID